MKNKFKKREKKKKNGMGTHLATCHPVPVPVCGCCAVHGRLGQRQCLHDTKNKLKKREKKKKRCGRAPGSPSPRSHSRSWPFMAVGALAAVWDSVGGCENQKVSQKKKETKK
jgi:hypothetical protein